MRAPCEAHNHVAGGTPTSSTLATTAVRLFVSQGCDANQGRNVDTLSCLDARLTMDAFIGETPRRREMSSDRSHNMLTVRGMPPDSVATMFTAGCANCSGGRPATVSLFSM